MAESLVDECLAKGSSSNITVLIIFFKDFDSVINNFGAANPQSLKKSIGSIIHADSNFLNQSIEQSRGSLILQGSAHSSLPQESLRLSHLHLRGSQDLLQSFNHT